MRKIYRNPRVLWREEVEALADACRGLDAGDDVEDIATSILFCDGDMLALNIVGTEVWKLCDGRDTDGVVSELLGRFDVDEETLRADVELFVAELAEKGFIRHAE